MKRSNSDLTVELDRLKQAYSKLQHNNYQLAKRNSILQLIIKKLEGVEWME